MPRDPSFTDNLLNVIKPTLPLPTRKFALTFLLFSMTTENLSLSETSQARPHAFFLRVFLPANCERFFEPFFWILLPPEFDDLKVFSFFMVCASCVARM